VSTNPITNLAQSQKQGKFAKRLPELSTRLKVILVSIALLSGSMGGALAFLMASKPFQQTQTPGITNSNSMTVSTAGLPELTRPVNILILGTIVLTSDLPDAEQQSKGKYLAQVNSTLNGQSDAILLVRFDPNHKRITALSVPRDSRVHIPEIGYGKINSANYVGGASLSAQTVSQTLGNVEIDRYFRVNVDGFGKLIDALGGVDIYVPKRMKYQDDSQHLYINLNPGQQHLDGNKAIQYMRFRHDHLGDIGRVQRQQTLIRSLIEQKLNLATVSRLPEILTVLKENIDTNLSVEEMLALAAFAAKTDRKDARMLMAPGRFSTPDEYPVSYWILNEKNLLRLMVAHFQVNVPPEALDAVNHSPGYLRVAVQDSISNPEGVKVAKDTLVKAGYGEVFPTDEPWAKPLAKTKIIAQQGDLESAEQVRNALGIGEVVLESTGSLDSDVTVRLGKDWLDLKSIQVYKPKPLLNRS
jgi:polyisoprenyl-teichoic acid--peptidoglycan teichoic acid transferase